MLSYDTTQVYQFVFFLFVFELPEPLLMKLVGTLQGYLGYQCVGQMRYINAPCTILTRETDVMQQHLTSRWSWRRYIDVSARTLFDLIVVLKCGRQRFTTIFTNLERK